MRFTINIGENEVNRLEYSFNQLLGRLVVKVNEQLVQTSRRLINEPVVETHVFEVGIQERHNVRIEKRRKQLLGYRNSVFVNNRLVGVFEGN